VGERQRIGSRSGRHQKYGYFSLENLRQMTLD
jgi:hypothetical protein